MQENLEDVEFKELQKRVLSNLVTSFKHPITTIQGFSKVLKLGVHGVLTKEQKNYMDTILDSCEFLNFQTQEVLDLLDLSHPSTLVSLAGLELQCICQQVVSRLTLLTNAKQQFLEFDSENSDLVLQNKSDIQEIKFEKSCLKSCLYYFIYYLILQLPHDSTIIVSLRNYSFVIEVRSKRMNKENNKNFSSYLELSRLLAKVNGGRIVEVILDKGFQYEIQF